MDFCGSKIAVLHEKTWKTLGREETVARQKMASPCPNTAPSARSHWAWPSAQCATAPSSPPHTACSSPLTVCSGSPRTPSTTISAQHIRQYLPSLEAAVTELLRKSNFRTKKLRDDMGPYKKARLVVRSDRGRGSLNTICPQTLAVQQSSWMFLCWVKMLDLYSSTAIPLASVLLCINTVQWWCNSVWGKAQSWPWKLFYTSSLGTLLNRSG